MSLSLDDHFVAFIDILGFSEMVKSDCVSPDHPKHLERLYKAHFQAIELFSHDIHANLTQFSDSIVFSRRFDISALGGFLESIRQWQQMILIDGLLCRGGIAFGRHFLKDKFMFSKAMIDAYEIESTKAKFPRIIISGDLIDLACAGDICSMPLVKEDDGAIFIDYLKNESDDRRLNLIKAIQNISNANKKSTSTVQEKIRWLERYSDYKLGTYFSRPHFSDV